MIARRSLVLLPLLLATLPVRADDGAWAQLREQGAIVLFRHATAPGTGDPPGFVLGDCATQRNLDARGRAEARAIGKAFESRGIAVGRVLTSQWCRARETAEIAFPGRAEEQPAFNSFFGNRAGEAEITAKARAILEAWRGPGVLVIVTHQVNIAALTGIVSRPGEGVVARFARGAATVLGRLPAPPPEG